MKYDDVVIALGAEVLPPVSDVHELNGYTRLELLVFCIRSLVNVRDEVIEGQNFKPVWSWHVTTNPCLEFTGEIEREEFIHRTYRVAELIITGSPLLIEVDAVDRLDVRQDTVYVKARRRRRGDNSH